MLSVRVRDPTGSGAPPALRHSDVHVAARLASSSRGRKPGRGIIACLSPSRAALDSLACGNPPPRRGRPPCRHHGGSWRACESIALRVRPHRPEHGMGGARTLPERPPMGRGRRRRRRATAGQRVGARACGGKPALGDVWAATLHAGAEAASRARPRVSRRGICRLRPSTRPARVRVAGLVRLDPSRGLRVPRRIGGRAWAIYAGGPDREADTTREAVRCLSPSVAAPGRALAAPHRPWAESCPRAGLGPRGRGGSGAVARALTKRRHPLQ